MGLGLGLGLGSGLGLGLGLGSGLAHRLHVVPTRISAVSSPARPSEMASPS